MKAVVLEIRNGIAAVMLEDGTIETVKRNCDVGDIIDVEPKDKVVPIISFLRSRPFKTVAAAAVAAVVAFSTTYYTTTTRAYSFVSVDAKPSLEFVLNARDRVIRVNARNEEARFLLEEMKDEKLKGKTLSEAMELTSQYLRQLGFMGGIGAEDMLLVSVSTADEGRAAKLTETIQTTMEEADGDVSLEICQTTMEERSVADSYDMTAARYAKAVESKNDPVLTASLTDGDTDTTVELSTEDIEIAKSIPVEAIMVQPTAEADPAPAPKDPQVGTAARTELPAETPPPAPTVVTPSAIQEELEQAREDELEEEMKALESAEEAKRQAEVREEERRRAEEAAKKEAEAAASSAAAVTAPGAVTPPSAGATSPAAITAPSESEAGMTPPEEAEVIIDDAGPAELAIEEAGQAAARADAEAAQPETVTGPAIEAVEESVLNTDSAAAVEDEGAEG